MPALALSDQAFDEWAFRQAPHVRGYFPPPPRPRRLAMLAWFIHHSGRIGQ